MMTFIYIAQGCFTELRQSYDCPIATEETPKKTGKIVCYQTSMKQNKV